MENMKLNLQFFEPQQKINLLQMYMRYYPKQLKPINRLEQISFDRGKRHFWGYDRGDYGFYKSEDKQYIRQMNKHKPIIKNSQRYSIQSNFDSAIKINNAREDKLHNQTAQKNLLKISNPQDIHLPSISRTNRQTQTELIIMLDKEISSRNDCRQRQILTQGHRRSMTQPIDNSDIKFSFPEKTRFSPTFVCSLNNPLPSYMINPHSYNSLSYVRSKESLSKNNQ